MFAGSLVADFRLPEFFTVPVKRHDRVLAIARAGDDDLVLPNDRCRAALGRKSRFPLHVFLVIERRDITAADSRAVFVRTAPVRPIRLRTIGQAGQRQRQAGSQGEDVSMWVCHFHFHFWIVVLQEIYLQLKRFPEIVLLLKPLHRMCCNLFQIQHQYIQYFLVLSGQYQEYRRTF